MCQPSAKVRQAVHEQEETVQCCNAKAQRNCECHHHQLLREEGSENEDNGNSNDGWDIKEEDAEEEEEEEGTHIGHLHIFVHHTDRTSCSV